MQRQNEKPINAATHSLAIESNPNT